MSPAKILIISSGPLCRNPRVLKEANTLGTAGYDVTVLTVANLARFETYDTEILREAPFKKRVVDHVSIAPIARLGHFTSRFTTWLAHRGTRLGWESAHAFGPLGPLGRLARQLPSDLIIVHTELAFCLGAQLLTEGRRVAADFEDWHSQDLLPANRSTRPLRLLRLVEHSLLQRAAYTSTTSHALAAALAGESGGKPPIVISNSFALQPLPAPSQSVGGPALLWFSQTIGPGRGLEPFLQAWGQTGQTSGLSLLGDVSPEYRQELLDQLPPSHRDRLSFLPLCSPAELPVVIARHQIGLALEPTTPANKDLTISNKILQYLNAGLVILATGTAGQREVLARAPAAGLEINLGDTSVLARQLDTLVADRPRLVEMGAAARRAAELIYSWEKEAPRLLAAVKKALATPAA